jgi:hypothetical protein
MTSSENSLEAKRLQATITLEYDDPQKAAAVAEAVSPDNHTTPTGLTVKTEKQFNTVVSEINLDGKIATFIATIDDLLESASTAEKTLHIVRRK